MGMVHIYTGDGKGKTTAAVGLCTRAAGHGKKAAFYEFLKGAKTGEAKSLAALGVEFYCPVEREKFTWTMTETEKAECRARQADTLARAAAHMAEYDLVVLDEVLCAVNAGMLSLADVLRFLLKVGSTLPRNTPSFAPSGLGISSTERVRPLRSALRPSR